MLQCQQYDEGTQCPNPSTHASSLCYAHQQQRQARTSVQPPYGDRQGADSSPGAEGGPHTPVDYVPDPNPTGCRAATTLGNPCRAPARRSRPYCVAHDPEFREQHLAHTRLGGVNSGRVRRSAADLEIDSVDLQNRAAIQALIDSVIRLQLTGHLPASRARSLERLIALAVRNFDTPARETYLDAITDTHDPATYYRTRTALDFVVDELGQSLRNAEVDDYARDVRFAAEKRKLIQEQLPPARAFAPRNSRLGVMQQLAHLATRP